MHWQHRGKLIWAAEMWQHITAEVENLAVKVRHEDAHMTRTVGFLENTTTMDRWIKLPRLKCLRWIWIDSVSVNYLWLSGPMTP